MKLVEKALIDIAHRWDAQANSLCYGLHAIRIVQTIVGFIRAIQLSFFYRFREGVASWSSLLQTQDRELELAPTGEAVLAQEEMDTGGE